MRTLHGEDEESGGDPFVAGEVRVMKLSASGLAVLVESTRKLKQSWVPVKAIHDDSEVWKPSDVGKLVVKHWFAEKEGWLGGKPKQAELPTQTKCRACDAEIVFRFNEVTDKWSPMNADGTSHFSNCPKADSFRRNR